MFLTRNNVQQLADLPGVGEHYMSSYNWILWGKWRSSYQNSLDHDDKIVLPFLASEDAETIDELLRGTKEESKVCSQLPVASIMHYELNNTLFLAHTKRWLDDGKGLMASKLVLADFNFPVALAHILWNSGGDAGIKMRPTNEELLSMSPEFDHR